MPKSKEQCKEMREEMRSRILHGSMLYFARNGFSGTKISDLAKHIGIGQGTIYVYFESKEELFSEIQKMVNYDADIRQMKFLSAMPISAEKKIHRLTNVVLRRLKEDESFAGMIALNTQMLLEQNADCAAGSTTYQTELYKYTARIIEQGQKEGSAVEGDAMMLADYYWGVVYLYSLKKLFTTQYEMIGAADLERTVLKN